MQARTQATLGNVPTRDSIATYMMEPNQDAEGTPAQQLLDSIGSRVETGWKNLRRITPFRRKRVLIGLDIGSEKTKAVVLHRPHGRVTVRQAAIAKTPASALTDGVFTDSITVADHVSFDALHVRHPREKCRGCRGRGRKSSFGRKWCPRTVTGTCCPLRVKRRKRSFPARSIQSCWTMNRFETPAGAPREIIWAGTMTEQIEWLREAVTLAGKDSAHR